MAPDPVNELKNAIAAAFSENLRQDAFIQEFWKKVQERDNGLTLEDVQKYSEHLGEAASKALRDTVGANALTDERFKQEIASRLVRPMLEQDFDDIQATANTVQKIHDESDGIGLNGLSADFPEERAAGLVEKLSGSENVEEARKYLGEPIVNFHMHGYDSWVHTNAKFRAEVGMTSRIIRRGHFGMCAWCAALVGTFEYNEDSMPGDVFRRHKYCKCVILFTSGRGKVQDVHSKIEYSSIRDARVARLRQLAQKRQEKEEAKKIMRDRVKNGEYSLTLSKQKYAEHVEGTPQYLNTLKTRKRDLSQLTVSYEKAQEIINLYSGTGDPRYKKEDGVLKVSDVEFCTASQVVGKYFDAGTKEYVDTRRFAIYHGKRGSHMVPVKPN